MISFEALVKKGGGGGTGFVRLPEKDSLKKGERIKVHLSNFEKDFFSTVTINDSLGFYIPRNLCSDLNLLGNTVSVRLAPIIDFYAKATSDGIVYLPQKAAREGHVRKNDVIELSLGNERYIAKVRSRIKRGTEEFYFTLGKNFADKFVSFSITKKLPAIKSDYPLEICSINENEGIIFDGTYPVRVRTNLDLNSTAFFLGAFLADGTKRGFSWGICASTPAQAKFYLTSHNSIILSPKVTWTLSFSSPEHEKELIIRKLIQEWKNEGFQIDKVRFHQFRSSSALKHNSCGTLVFKENRVGVLNYYNYLLEKVVKKITQTKDKKMAFEFLCGILEGDGTVNAKKRAHVQIATNVDDYETIEKILQITKMNYALVRETETRLYFRIGVLEIIKNLEAFYPLVFKYYPKRRQNLILRMSDIGVVKFLLGKQRFLSGWIKAEFKKSGILKKDYTLTKKGMKIQRLLQNMLKKVE